MKKSIPLLIVMLFMTIVSCSIDIEPTVSLNRPQNQLVFTAEFGDYQNTKTIVQSDGSSIWWNAHEDINIFYGNSESSKFTSTNDEPIAKAQFRGTIEAFTGQTESGEPNSFCLSAFQNRHIGNCNAHPFRQLG